MINPNNLEQLAYELEQVLETKVATGLLNVLSEKQRAFLVVCIRKWSLGGTINEKDPVDIIKEILDRAKEIIKMSKYVSPKLEAYHKLKIYD